MQINYPQFCGYFCYNEDGDNMEKRYCINCGKPIKDEDTCPNCHYSTEISKAGATSIYPEIECKEANVSFGSNKVLLLIALVCIFVGGIVPALVYSANAETIEKSFAIIDRKSVV